MNLQISSRLIDPILAGAMVLAVGFCAPAWVRADETQGSLKIEEMSAAEKEELLRKREQFNRLATAEQQRLRSLHQAIESHADADDLQAVVNQYAEWLTTLSTNQRADLLSLPLEERIKKIREIKRSSELSRFKDFTRLSEEDTRQVFKWLDEELIATARDRIMSDEKERRRFDQLDPKARFHLKMRVMGILKSDESLPTAEQIDKLVARLSDEAQEEFLLQDSVEKKRMLARGLIQAVTESRRRPPEVSPDELERFFSELSPEDQERLERLPPDRMKRELTFMFVGDQMRRRMPGGPRFWGRDRGDRRSRRGGDDSDARGGPDRRGPEWHERRPGRGGPDRDDRRGGPDRFERRGGPDRDERRGGPGRDERRRRRPPPETPQPKAQTPAEDQGNTDPSESDT